MKDNATRPKTTFEEIVSEAIAAFFSDLIAYPSHTLWTIQQENSARKPLTFRQSYRQFKTDGGDFKHLFKGFSVAGPAAVVGIFPYLYGAECATHWFGSNDFGHAMKGIVAQSFASVIWVPATRIVELEQASISQSSGNAFKQLSAFQKIQFIRKNDGVRGFYRGAFPHFCINAFNDALGFWLRAHMLAYFPSDQRNHVVPQLACTIPSFGIAYALTTPLAVVETRLRIHETNPTVFVDKTFLGAARTLIKQRGFKGFFHGTSTSFLYGAVSSFPIACSGTFEKPTHAENVMPDHKKDHNKWLKLHGAGLSASLFSFCVVWPIDTTSTRLRFYNKLIFQGGVRQSFYNYRDAISPDQKYQNAAHLVRSFGNVGFYWGFMYLALTGMITLPLQAELQHHFIQRTEAKNDQFVLFLRALAGWCAAFLQLALLHPIDSMKVTAQKNPVVFKNDSVRYFFTQQSQLRRGMGVVAAGSATHFVAWCAKLSTQRWLEQTMFDVHFKTTISAFAFSLTHIMLAFPVNTIKTWAQGDPDFNACNKTFFQKAARTIALTRNNVKALGPTCLYRGFFSRGAMHMCSFALQMTAFDTFQSRISSP